MIKLVTFPIKVNHKYSEHRTGHHYQDSSFQSRSSPHYNGKKLVKENWLSLGTFLNISEIRFEAKALPNNSFDDVVESGNNESLALSIILAIYF